MPANLVSELKQHYGVVVSPCYERMSARGLLRSRTAEGGRKNGQRLGAPKPHVLKAHPDLEWLAPEEILRRAAAHRGKPSDRPRWPAFVAFAQGAAGNEWGWVPSLAARGKPSPVVHIEHDSDEATFEAPDFEAFVFMKALQCLAYCAHDRGALDATVTVLRDSVKCTLPFLKPAFRAALEPILKRPFYKVTTERLALQKGKLRSASKDVHVYVVTEEFAGRVTKRLVDDRRIGAPLSATGRVQRTA
ncbi:MAG: hypothetical protein QM778_18195 [Myxococcales bacterium]